MAVVERQAPRTGACSFGRDVGTFFFFSGAVVGGVSAGASGMMSVMMLMLVLLIGNAKMVKLSFRRRLVSRSASLGGADAVIDIVRYVSGLVDVESVERPLAAYVCLCSSSTRIGAALCRPTYIS